MCSVSDHALHICGCGCHTGHFSQRRSAWCPASTFTRPCAPGVQTPFLSQGLASAGPLIFCVPRWEAVEGEYNSLHCISWLHVEVRKICCLPICTIQKEWTKIGGPNGSAGNHWSLWCTGKAQFNPCLVFHNSDMLQQAAMRVLAPEVRILWLRVESTSKFGPFHWVMWAASRQGGIGISMVHSWCLCL